MNYKQIPFDINIAKDIVSGKIDGKIKTLDGKDVVIYDFNFRDSRKITYYPSIVGKIINSKHDDILVWSENGLSENISVSKSMDLVLLIKEEHKFKPFDRILVPTFSFVTGFKIWKCSFFSCYLGDFVIDMENVNHLPEKILPFEGNEYLVGKPV